MTSTCYYGEVRYFGIATCAVVLAVTSRASADPQTDRAAAQQASPTPSDGRDTLLNVSAAVPAAGTLRAIANGGGDRNGPSYGAGMLWSVGAGFAAEAGMSGTLDGAAPAAAIRWQALSQERAGVDALAVIRYGSFSAESPGVSGGSIAGELALARAFGRFRLTLDGMIARGLVDRDDVDARFGASALVAINRRWTTGLEARAQTEVQDDYDTPEDHGRSFDLIAGAIGAVRFGPAYVQLLAGWRSPRGLAAAGPAGLAQLTFDF